LNLVLPWPPSGNHATRHPSRGVHYLTDAHKVFRKAVAAIVMQVRAKQVASPYSATVVWHPPNRRHVDSDNLQKTLFDALQKAGVIENDSLHHKIAYSETVVWPTKPQIREQP
jgi:crossover junction endodeoxyribonuclease RusA